MIRTREQAAKAAENTKTNVPNTCQIVTRGYFNAPSVGDFDGDGAADAEDGWKSEPKTAKHPGDRNPPRGVPVSFVGGRNDHGHRAIVVGGKAPIRSTDFDGRTRRYRAGVVGNGTLEEVEAAMGVSYAGWSDTIDNHPIPKDKPKPKPKPKVSRGARVDRALKDLKAAKKGKGERAKRILAAISALEKIEPISKKK